MKPAAMWLCVCWTHGSVYTQDNRYDYRHSSGLKPILTDTKELCVCVCVCVWLQFYFLSYACMAVQVHYRAVWHCGKMCKSVC